MSTETLLQTPLHAFHAEAGAKMVPFAGWSMPLHYGSIIDEHHQVRERGGVFDVSHMGRFDFTGRDVEKFLNRLCTRKIDGMEEGQARYSLICNENGGCRDDVLVYRVDASRYMMVCNAANRAKILEHIDEVREDDVFKLTDITEKSVMIAVQGPRVMEVIGHFSREVPGLKRYRFAMKNVLGLEMMISRTGYTGEDGVEVIFRTDNLVAKVALGRLLKELTSAGDSIRPAGLGARDSLRLEAAMALYGHEIDEEIDPLSAGLNFAVKVDKDTPFIGQPALQAVAKNGPANRLVGLELKTRRAARQNMSVLHQGAEVGRITSGVHSPTLGKSIAMAYVPAALAEEGTSLHVPIGQSPVVATVVPLPFYKS